MATRGQDSREPLPSAAEAEFASARRDSPEELRSKAVVIEASSLLRFCLDAMPNMVLILNENRQIIAANQALLGQLNTTLPEILGLRSGEAFGCIRSATGDGGCGTSRYCATCGNVQAILASLEGESSASRECRILVSRAEGVRSLDLKATATVFLVGENRFVLVALEDISDRKRLAVLQRACFHDVLNTAGCIQGYLSYMAKTGYDESIQHQVGLLTERLVDEIGAHRELVYAESGELKIVGEPVQPAKLLESLRLQYLRHPVAENREILVEERCYATMITDPQILMRVLGNMVKNALEATPVGGKVTAGSREQGDTVVFRVSNSEVMPEEVQNQIFQRSFSTKAMTGRGVGTYSMRLLTERYLRGSITFRSSQTEGTTFEIVLPRALST